jgi:predicted nucleic acid-binding protein
VTPRRALIDTSVLIAEEAGRPIARAHVPMERAVSVVTIAELHLGVLSAEDTETRSRRLTTLNSLAAVDPLPITVDVARQWALLRSRLAEAGRRAKINDLWIAAIAAANGLDVVTQDGDFDPIEAVGGPAVIRV